jgi:3-dehydroquinate synthase
MDPLIVNLGTRSYPIYIGSGLLSDERLLQQHIAGHQVLIVSNETVAPLYLEQVKSAYKNIHTDVILLPDGEQYKSLNVLEEIFDILINNKHQRDTTIIALGGGVIGDIAGFAAACYQRGVNFIQIPTTLLAQVDSSVGGKTAVNHHKAKNMIGAFHQPKCVIIDVSVLNTLDERQFRSGLAEVIKYGMGFDHTFFEWLEQKMPQLLQLSQEHLITAIKKSCSIKANVVSEDEREQGLRALLNLGHTFGHAIETAGEYKKWLHGEAIAIGLYLAADLSHRMGYLEADAVSRVKALLEQTGFATGRPHEVTVDQFMEIMSRDKKIMKGQQRFILLSCYHQTMTRKTR